MLTRDGRLLGHVLMWDFDGRPPPEAWCRWHQREGRLGPVHVLRSSRDNWHAISYDVHARPPAWWARAPGMDPLQCYWHGAHGRVTLRLSGSHGTRPRPRYERTLDAPPARPWSAPHASMWSRLGVPTPAGPGAVGEALRWEIYSCRSCARGV